LKINKSDKANYCNSVTAELFIVSRSSLNILLFVRYTYAIKAKDITRYAILLR